MELNQLRYFVTLANTCNYSKAAEELFIAQPTLSQQIKRLESELGVQLFDRSTRKVTLTPIGQECLRYARQSVEAADMLQQAASEKQRMDLDTVNIGVLMVYPYYNVSNVLGAFRSAYPDIDPQLTFGASVDLMDMLMRRKLDAIIANVSPNTLTPDTLEELQMHVFWQDTLCVVSSSAGRFAGKDSVSLMEVCDSQLFFTNMKSSAKLRFEMEVRSRGYSVPSGIECPSMSSLFNFVTANMGISVMSHHVARAYLKEGTMILPIDPPIPVETALIMKKHNNRPALLRFWDYFVQNLQIVK